eukprot:scaffold85457_cov50-Phaeocystis_antarctica.AAC.1
MPIISFAECSAAASASHGSKQHSNLILASISVISAAASCCRLVRPSAAGAAGVAAGSPPPTSDPMPSRCASTLSPTGHVMTIS